LHPKQASEEVAIVIAAVTSTKKAIGLRIAYHCFSSTQYCSDTPSFNDDDDDDNYYYYYNYFLVPSVVKVPEG